MADTVPKYKYTVFFLLFIAFASAFNYYLTYDDIHLDAKLALTYTLDTVEGWIAWYAMHRIILRLDQKLPYGDRPLRRIVIQTLITTIVGLAIIIALTEAVSWIRKGRPATPDFYMLDIFIVIIWFLLINGIYVGIYFYEQWDKSEQLRKLDKKVKATGFHIRYGKQDLHIAFEAIFGFYSEDGFTYVQTWDNKNYVSDHSLDKVEKMIPSEIFFRLNRKYLLCRRAISGFKRIEDGKLEVFVKPMANIPDVIPVSRIRAVPFKRDWFPVDAIGSDADIPS